MCEWCGHEHDRAALCAARPKWSRRGFLSLFGAGLAGAVLAAKIPFADFAVNTTGTIGGIDRATFSFWRNQQLDGLGAIMPFDNLKAVMRDVYRNCSSGDGDAAS